jgi:hypothetical protein
MDFDVSSELGEEPLQFDRLMAIMKDQSADKRTIQALSDKILLHSIADNIQIQQMPLLYSSHGKINAGEVERLVESLESSGDPNAFDIVAKPTHLSNSSGTLVLTTETWESCEFSADALVDHMETYLREKAADNESAALQSVMPGFVIQPRYTSCVAYDVPIEVRVVTLWGKTRAGIWWWAPKSADSTSRWERNAWIVQPQAEQRSSRWHVIHENPYANAEYEQALQLILQAMPAMAAAAEKIATAVGAPFLRSDFFVGSAKFGVRLNEVAYGSNIDLRKLAKTLRGHADDSTDVAQILQEGYRYCSRQPPEYFLSRLGVQGSAYEPEWWKFWQATPGMHISQLHHRNF